MLFAGTNFDPILHCPVPWALLLPAFLFFRFYGGVAIGLQQQEQATAVAAMRSETIMRLDSCLWTQNPIGFPGAVLCV